MPDIAASATNGDPDVAAITAGMRGTAATPRVHATYEEDIDRVPGRDGFRQGAAVGAIPRIRTEPPALLAAGVAFVDSKDGRRAGFLARDAGSGAA